VSLWGGNHMADLSLSAGNGDWQREGALPLKRSWRADRFCKRLTNDTFDDDARLEL
jgi:hypothetical protein